MERYEDMKNAKVSVIIPTYKGSKSLRRTVESVLNQTYENTEIIVVDDNGVGSDDQKETEKRIIDYITTGKVSYLTHKTNKNGSAARNTGINASNGDYIAFLDDDDVWDKRKLEEQIKAFSGLDESYGLLYCGGYNVDLSGYGGPKVSKFMHGNILYPFLNGKIDFNSSMFIIRRSVLQTVKGFDESYRRLQDWEFCTRILYHYKGYGIKRYLVVKYRAERNIPSPDALAKIIEEHIKKSASIIDSLGPQRAKAVRAQYYRRVALEYLRKRDIKNTIRYLQMDESLLKGVVLLFEFIMRYGINRIRYRRHRIILE